ncbi:hypothetical protein BJY04DRAFT_182616 [Aspergillus karnatakaensis]|uniref:uncharacterized protein n=1 Tax=Aspergillus karnatakaensis TaxID=1810916 RepID=UPI003CCE3071
MKSTMKIVSALSALALAQAQQLEKPALTSNLDYLLDGNAANLPEVASQISQWEAGFIPKDCKDLGEGEGLNAADFEVYDVTYDDCSDPWLICRHKDAEPVIADVANTFGKLPVKIRDWVRQVLVVPGGNSAFAINGNVAFIGTTGTNVDVMIHEAAHGLDGFAAFGENLSTSQKFLDAYNADTHVPDDYARSSQAENVAQNTVVAVYDRNVPGGFPGVQPEYEGILNQYTVIKDLGGDALIPGGTCDRHLENSETVSTTANSRLFRKGEKPDTSFKGSYGNIVTEFEGFEVRESF